MPNNLFEEMVASYIAADAASRQNATRETMQIIALAGLNRGGFFEHAAFYGGTCLRIFYGLDRYSEDLDFSLLEKSESFSLARFFHSIEEEFELAGCKIAITEKKPGSTAIYSAMLKSDNIKIKLEVDTAPPLLFDTEYRLSMKPYSFMTKCFTLQSSLAGKMSALLFRGWRNRIKGRDWYDFEWFVRNDVAMDLRHFNERARQFGKINEDLTPAAFRDLLREKIESADISKIKEDLTPFVGDISKLDIWSREYFLQVADLIRITNMS